MSFASAMKQEPPYDEMALSVVSGWKRTVHRHC
jgi:hypothetical protein